MSPGWNAILAAECEGRKEVEEWNSLFWKTE